jgi:hypothetical protein
MMIDPNLPQENDNSSLSIDRTLEKRIDQMLEGALELRQWLFDVFRQGLGNLQTQPDNAWEAIAANMSNAKLTAIARRIRKLKKLSTLPNWPTIFLQELADYYLFAESFTRIRELPPNFQEELLNQGGRTPKEKDVIDAQHAIKDQWLVIGQKFGQMRICGFNVPGFWVTNPLKLPYYWNTLGGILLLNTNGKWAPPLQVK